MKTEFEAKFYPIDAAAFRQRLIDAGARLAQPERLLRIVAYNNRLNPQIDAHYIRLRHEGDAVRLSAKIHADADGDLADQKETDITVSDFDAAKSILEHAGLKQTGYQEKLRETWQLDDAEVVIDTWPGLETYVEIEAGSEAAVRAVSEHLGLDWESRRITSVVEIFAEVYGVDVEQALQMLSHATFQQNPFAGMPRMMRNIR